METMQKITTVKWFDPDSTETVKLAAQAYGIKVLATYPTETPDEVDVTVGGPTENVDRFLEDLDEGDIEPFESKRELSDNDYQYWLMEELGKLGVKYSPAYSEDEAESEES